LPVWNKKKLKNKYKLVFPHQAKRGNASLYAWYFPGGWISQRLGSRRKYIHGMHDQRIETRRLNISGMAGGGRVLLELARCSGMVVWWATLNGTRRAIEEVGGKLRQSWESLQKMGHERLWGRVRDQMI
jgi:hypothetical protein